MRNVYYESRGEPVEGQVAVARVTLNRLKTHAPTICKVVFQKKQFSWTLKPVSKRIDKVAWDIAEKAAVVAYNTEGFEATHYHNTSVSPKWGLTKVTQIGNHIFYRQ